MAGMVRVTTRWDGFPGAPGYTNFYGSHNGVSAQDSADQFADDIHDFWLQVNGYIPDSVTLTIVPTWQSLSDSSGQLTGEGQLASPPAAVTGNNAGSYAGNVGVAINWVSETVLNGRFLKGRTYLIPMTGVFDQDGTLSAAAISAIGTSALALAEGSTNMLVWHRPVNGSGGSSAQIATVTIKDRAAILRSRSL